MTFENISNVLKKANKITILPHISVDGDGLGSSLALGLSLKKLGKEVFIYLEESIPRTYGFLKGYELVKVYDDENVDCDVVVALDTGDLKRLGKRQNIFLNSIASINIDHHVSNTLNATWNHVDIKAAAVGELVFDLIKSMGIQIDQDIAECIYVAISTDTGAFKYSNTSSKTHKIASELIQFKINISEISRKIFDSYSFEKLKLIGIAINSMETFEEGKIAIITVSCHDLDQSGASEDDLDGIINFARNLNGVEVALLLKEREKKDIKINFRSNQYIDVAELASKYNGGGHKRAAGCIMNGSFDDIKKILIDDIKKRL